jgi:2,3-bisphosphoglycerate-dependent phosphoglycerate mutase
MELLLIRHAEPIRVENLDAPADPRLHDRGTEQALRLAAWLAEEPEPIAELWSSPLRRALETTAPVATALALEPNISDGLAEWDRLATEYIPIEELREAKDERWQALITGRALLEHVESADVFREAVVAAIEPIVAANPGRRVAVICHGGVINMYLSWVLGMASQNFFLPHYTSVSRVAAARSGPRSILSINETGHLRGLPGF